VARLFFSGTVIVAAVAIIDAFLFADLTGLSALRAPVAIALAAAIIMLIATGASAPPALMIAVGAVTLALHALAAVLAPPRGPGWVPFLATALVPAALVLWGIRTRRGRRTRGAATSPTR
jgi:CHASE2 domain-containing sensor protein